ncbi:hypothetical protein NP493_829g01085 [Ridgeia piscesae]|uniref:Uncharacterized protein n=1 Tax=Ridgeia piscesae TaxID=27915 RepID=A0AAD9NNZ5_RIDPI|nr:hypothetical protein NP493_829g01085 [Ridgeia piscesae]
MYSQSSQWHDRYNKPRISSVLENITVTPRSAVSLSSRKIVHTAEAYGTGSSANSTPMLLDKGNSLVEYRRLCRWNHLRRILH